MNSAAALYAGLAALAGICVALQASINSAFRKNLSESPLWAVFFSVCGTILFAGVAMLALRPTLPAMETLRETPWWNWVGGALGTLIVAAGAFLVRPLGAAAFIALVIAGQLVASAVFDHFGLFGLEQKVFTWGRAAGLLLVIAGVAAIKYL